MSKPILLMFGAIGILACAAFVWQWHASQTEEVPSLPSEEIAPEEEKQQAEEPKRHACVSTTSTYCPASSGIYANVSEGYQITVPEGWFYLDSPYEPEPGDSPWFSPVGYGSNEGLQVVRVYVRPYEDLRRETACDSLRSCVLSEAIQSDPNVRETDSMLGSVSAVRLEIPELAPDGTQTGISVMILALREGKVYVAEAVFNTQNGLTLFKQHEGAIERMLQSVTLP